MKVPANFLTDAGGTQADAPDPRIHRRLRHETWAATKADGRSVLLLGSEQGTVESLLAREGRFVASIVPADDAAERIEQALALEPKPNRSLVKLVLNAAKETRGLDSKDPLSFLTRDLVPREAGTKGFDTVMLLWTIASHMHPELLLRAAVSLARPGGRLVITVPFGPASISDQLISMGLRDFRDLVRSCCVPEELTAQDGAIRFVGRIQPVEPGDWKAYDADALLTMSEQAYARQLEQTQRLMEWHRDNLRRMSWSARYLLGTMLVDAFKKPWTAWRIPGRFYQLYRAKVRAANSAHRGALASGRSLTIPAYPPVTPHPPAEPRIAAILDSFSEFCLRYDANLLLLSRKHWKSELERDPPSLLFVESAWYGNYGQWSGLIADSDGESLNALREVVDTCKSRGIPTVFWNKEDPPGFDAFRAAAELFDFVFTTDANCIPRYWEACGHDRVFALPFAAQPAIHNPQRNPLWQAYPVCFAGSWMGSKYPERSAELDALLAGAMKHHLHIFDRNFGLGDDRLKFPEKYRSAVLGSLSYQEMLTAYRIYQVMLNANSVQNSPTMFSRRVFESLACGTPVLSTASTGMEAMLPGLVFVAHGAEESSRVLKSLLGSEETRHKRGHLGYRFVHTHHTYRHRLSEVMEKVGLPMQVPLRQPPVTVAIASNRPGQIEAGLENYVRQDYPNKELFLVLNNAQFDVEAIRRRVDQIPNAHLLHVDHPTTLGECLNTVIDRCSGAYFAKMDDDDHYGSHYLSDSMLAARFSEAEIVGKGTYFTYLAGSNQMALRTLRPEHSSADIVSGATFLVRRDVFDNTRFRALKRGTDTAFLEDAAADGSRIYSADRYNFVLMRRANAADHTWRIDTDEFLRLCEDVRTGLELDRAMI